jgi:hypothetical protein
MPRFEVRVLRDTPEGVEVGSEPCACGGCRPTASVFREDHRYERHDGALAQGPCCCDRFFVVGPEAEERAQLMAAERRGTEAYAFERHELALPWGGSTSVVVGDFRS